MTPDRPLIPGRLVIILSPFLLFMYNKLGSSSWYSLCWESTKELALISLALLVDNTLPGVFVIIFSNMPGEEHSLRAFLVELGTTTGIAMWEWLIFFPCPVLPFLLPSLKSKIMESILRHLSSFLIQSIHRFATRYTFQDMYASIYFVKKEEKSSMLSCQNFLEISINNLEFSFHSLESWTDQTPNHLAHSLKLEHALH